MLKKILSYLIPMNVFQKESVLSKNLEITWNNGELVLDSKNTNYSYGSLQRVLRTGLKAIGHEKIVSMQNILVLGVAGGSVIKVLSHEIGYKGKITGVEIDRSIIELANTYFHLNKIPNLEIIITDAFDFVMKSEEKYNLVIVDIFQDNLMPDFLFSDDFIRRIPFLLKKQGTILFNTMIVNKNDVGRNREYIAKFAELQFKTTALPRLEGHNELILLEKLSEK